MRGILRFSFAAVSVTIFEGITRGIPAAFFGSPEHTHSYIYLSHPDPQLTLNLSHVFSVQFRFAWVITEQQLYCVRPKYCYFVLGFQDFKDKFYVDKINNNLYQLKNLWKASSLIHSKARVFFLIFFIITLLCFQLLIFRIMYAKELLSFITLNSPILMTHLISFIKKTKFRK